MYKYKIIGVDSKRIMQTLNESCVTNENPEPSTHMEKKYFFVYALTAAIIKKRATYQLHIASVIPGLIVADSS